MHKYNREEGGELLKWDRLPGWAEEETRQQQATSVQAGGAERERRGSRQREADSNASLPVQGRNREAVCLLFQRQYTLLIDERRETGGWSSHQGKAQAGRRERKSANVSGK